MNELLLLPVPASARIEIYVCTNLQLNELFDIFMYVCVGVY